MTRKDYQILADAIGEARAKVWSEHTGECQNAAVRGAMTMMHGIMAALQKDNPLFNATVFRSAVIEADVRRTEQLDR